MLTHDQYDAYDDFDDEPRPARARRKHRFDDEKQPERSGRLTEHARELLAKAREDALTRDIELPPWADRWTTWGDGEHGPHPRPDWLITELSAVDTELGVLKTGKEADVHLVERSIPDTDRSCLLAAKRYRSNEHRLFHRDAGYLEGRRVRKSREMRAMTNRTAFGRNLLAEQWSVAEFAALSRLWSIGAPVPYPAQRNGTELLLEFLDDGEGGAAPRLAQLRPDPEALADLWEQLVAALELMAAEGLTHGDLSAFNLLVQDGHLMLIDLPQVVDVVANPQGREFLARDVANIAGWFSARGLPDAVTDPLALTERLLDAAGLG
ncbi:MAG TPA: RIO1 family regulatory kinase/ATPase [Actinophytocola sp.]|uniref:serine protein kinase RIO n=1 Tax=Actinophytocola sp. TaxID=1872138 RepID=UPI002DDD82F2|nr:RIO1 family regulatory kinase/ATPase [Actinophytocola sp.]HEV2783305.1 RIO1 family regulatory kinase/ATPase [Actinophytocola sp.]